MLYLRYCFQHDLSQLDRPGFSDLFQLDDRYFRGLEGQYSFKLHFILINAKTKEEIVRARPASFDGTLPIGARSVSAEIDLEPGEYEVLPKILATRDLTKDLVEDVVVFHVDSNPQKLRQLGINHDVANAKATVMEQVIAREGGRGRRRGRAVATQTLGGEEEVGENGERVDGVKDGAGMPEASQEKENENAGSKKGAEGMDQSNTAKGDAQESSKMEIEKPGSVTQAPQTNAVPDSESKEKSTEATEEKDLHSSEEKPTQSVKSPKLIPEESKCTGSSSKSLFIQVSYTVPHPNV